MGGAPTVTARCAYITTIVTLHIHGGGVMGLSLAVRCVICAVIEAGVRLAFTWLPGHMGRTGSKAQHKWAAFGAIIATLPYTGVLIATLVLLDMHANSPSVFQFNDFATLCYTVIVLCPVNVLTTWLPVTVAERAATDGHSTVISYVISMAVTGAAWVCTAPLAYFTMTYTMASALPGAYATAFSFATVGVISTALLTRMPYDKWDNTGSSGEGRGAWVKWVVAAVGAGVVVTIAIVAADAGGSNFAFAGMLAGVPLGTWAGFSVLWLQRLPARSRKGSAKDRAYERASRARSVLWPAAWGYRSYDMFYAIVPSLVHAVGWGSWGWAVASAFGIASVATLAVGWGLYVSPAIVAGEGRKYTRVEGEGGGAQERASLRF